MSKFSSIFVALSLLSFTHARSITYRDWPAHRDHCLSDSEAASLVATLESFYVRIDPVLAAKTLTPDYEELSYSTLRPGPGKIPPGDVVAANRAQFITQEEAGGSGGVPFQTLNVWHGCDNISFRWLLAVTDPSTNILYEYYGIDVLEVVPGTYKIKADYSEFSV